MSGGGAPQRLLVYNGGFLNRRIRRILTLAGLPVTTGRPRAGDTVGVWGHSLTAHRGEGIAARYAMPLIRIEDAFLRSLHPGRAGEPPLGLLIDRRAMHFDSARPSDLEVLLATHPLDDTALLDRAREGMALLPEAHVTKYAAVDPGGPVPEPGYVLVVDQTRGDASITHGAGSAAMFAEMLAFARIENLGARIVLKTHPETAAGHRAGHYGQSDLDDRTVLLNAPVSPWTLLQGATAVYAVTSQLGFEAIVAGHRPRIFGQPFYGGWGLTADENPVPRRERKLTRAQLFAAAMILYPTWYDPYRDRLCSFEQATATLAAQARAWREDRQGYVASGMRLWKRAPLQRFFGTSRGLVFVDDPARASARAATLNRPLMVWAGKQTPDHQATRLIRIEDGLLRSRGLGAELIAPLSLVCDDLGIYYDPTRPSRLETLIERSIYLRPAQIQQSERLIRTIATSNLSKYNIGGDAPSLPTDRPVILVPGQVEDDASIRLGTDAVATNTALLHAARDLHPDACLIYKPHPDVEAGLRPGALSPDRTAVADVVVARADPARLLAQVDAVVTMTSTLGFEALLRGLPVSCLGTPFYAGWGLTRDLGRVPARRTARPSLAALAHAILIDYPRYRDPVTGLPCPVEIIVERLASDRIPAPGPANRLLAKAQGLAAGYGAFWR